MDKYIVDSQFIVVEVDGQEWTIVLLTTDPEARHLVSDKIWEAREKNDHFLTAVPLSDGKLGILASPELEQKILAKISPNREWSKVRLYP
jgi:hypothetical protein